jgi:metal-sulfur cluster biosynthetic enzyme
MAVVPPALDAQVPPFPFAGPAEWLAPVVAALMRVVDPELALSIVDVGLVRGVALEDGRARVRLTMTSAACPVTDVIIEDVQAELNRVLPAEWTIEVSLNWEPAWSPAEMSERARQFMRW